MLELEPTKQERWLIYRCLLTQGVLIGDEDDIWSVNSAYRTLATWRLCIDAIERLFSWRLAITTDSIQAVVMQTDDMDGVPFCLSEVATFLYEDVGARHYWQVRLRDEKFPHRCDRCGAAAYIGFFQIECKARCRQ